MTKRITRNGKLSNDDLLKIEQLIKAETSKINYGVAGTPLATTKRAPAPKREVNYGENRYSYNRNKKVTFKQCEDIAENNPILRMAIEYIKSGVSNTSFTFVDKNSNKETRAAKEVKSFFEYPDKDSNLKSWIKQIVEDILVTDTACVYNEVNALGNSLRVTTIDGTLVQPIVDARGNIPIDINNKDKDRDNLKVYQMKVGKDIYSYSRNELIYHPTNRRTKQKYGFSKVAQAYQIANLFDKAMKDFNDYYDGNIANVIASLKGMNDINIDALDALVGYYEEQRNNANKYTLATFPEATFHNLKQVDLKSNVHDFYIRIVCAIFNVPYQYFIAEVNRATAETSKDTTEQKGLRDMLDNVEEIINKIIKLFLKNDDVIFKFVIDVPTDPDKLATRLTTLTNSKLITVNEARLELGYPAIEGGDVLLQAPAPSPTADTDSKDDDQDADKKDLKKSGNIKDEEIANAFKEAEMAFESLFATTILDSQKEAILEAIKSGATINEDLLTKLEIPEAVALAFIEEFSAISQKVSVTFVSRLNDIYNINNIKAFEASLEALTAYNTERSAELIGKRFVSGKLVDNPSPLYSINETTRDELKGLIDKAMQTGMSNQALAKEIQDSFMFSAERAKNIATYETNASSNFTAQNNYKEAGIDLIEWSITYNDNNVCENCIANENQGPIKIDDVFKSGHKHPPAHPRCRCTLNPVFNKNYRD